MKSLPLIASILILCYGCTSPQKYFIETKVAYNQALAKKLASMAKVDQTAAWIKEGKFKSYSDEAWNAYKDSVFSTHKKELEIIFREHGYPGYDLVGEVGENNFWLMVQHSDFDPVFQKRVLDALALEVEKGNADGSNFGLLTDRVNLNTGLKQIYGTQVRYHAATGQAYPKPLEDCANVNKRRAAVGLEPIEEYLNRMTILHFEMNKENMLKRGILEPKLYELK